MLADSLAIDGVRTYRPMMNKTQGPSNSKALIAYCHQEALNKEALDLVRKLYAKEKRKNTPASTTSATAPLAYGCSGH